MNESDESSESSLGTFGAYVHYGKYRSLRDSVWKCLIEYRIDRLPVDIVSIARRAGIQIIRNSWVRELRPHESGLTYFDGDNWFIIYDDSQSLERCRFTVTHELGHIFLGHSGRKGYAVRRSDHVHLRQHPEIEQAADMFAARLLCPSCVLWALELRTADEISKECCVSHQAASIRAERMRTLYSRNRFLTSPLERRVFDNFHNYIRARSADRTSPSGSDSE